jgi:hypothetical protein
MKPLLSLLVLVLVIPGSQLGAQDRESAREPIESLRQQLIDVKAKEAELQVRLRQVEEDIKPENIERSLAGVGSTRPEELREQRRKELAIERDGILNQLKVVSSSRERLESVIQTADDLAYQNSAEGNAKLLSSGLTRSNWLLLALVGIVGVGALVIAFVLIKRSRVSH